jgi:hypothetical protein
MGAVCVIGNVKFVGWVEPLGETQHFPAVALGLAQERSTQPTSADEVIE